jgi:hypothetical protein
MELKSFTPKPVNNFYSYYGYNSNQTAQKAADKGVKNLRVEFNHVKTQTFQELRDCVPQLCFEAELHHNKNQMGGLSQKERALSALDLAFHESA